MHHVNTRTVILFCTIFTLSFPAQETIPFAGYTPNTRLMPVGLLMQQLKLPGTSSRVRQVAPLEAFTTHLDQRISGLMDDYDIPGVIVALVKNGKPAWSAAYGYADLSTGRRMTTATYCRVESISKPVTAWGVMHLVEQGQINLDQPVVNYLQSWSFPESSFPVEKITVRQLLSHSAGLQLGTIGVRYDPTGEVPTLRKSLAKDAILQQEPEQSFSYSNTGFNVLEVLIEDMSGRDFATYMEEEVLRPLGMNHASFTWQESFDPPVPNGYDNQGHPIPVYVYPEKAAGGLFATVGDIATFVTAGMPHFSSLDQHVLADTSIQELYRPVTNKPGAYGLAFDAYGLGHFIETLPDGHKAYSHGGQGSGWMTHFHSVPETGDGIVILTNSQRSWPFFSLVLSDWAAWCGFPNVGMGLIAQATRWLWVLIGLLLLGALWQMWRVSKGLFSGTRHFAPWSGESRRVRLVQSLFFVIILSVLLWAVSQDYLFFTSVFPVASGRLGIALLVLGTALLLAVLFPVKVKKIKTDDKLT